jgi:DNA-binding beta-propeller fold protein YncE
MVYKFDKRPVDAQWKRIAVVSIMARLAIVPLPARAEILALVNYESKPPDALKTFKNPVAGQARREGIAVLDVDPKSANFGKILMDMPLPPDLVAHHIFYNKNATKAYVTALGKPELRVIDMKRFPYRTKIVQVPQCQVGEDVVFSDDNKNWYLTCMGSHKVIVGDASRDRVTRVIDVPNYPHGIAVNNAIDRVLATSTVRASDLGDPGETITVIEASTGKVLSTHKVTDKASPAGDAPVEILFVPRSNPPVAYITNMFGNSLSVAVWNPAKKQFAVRQAFDFAAHNAGVPLEMYFNTRADRFYVTTAKPGHLHIFDVGGAPGKPKLLKTLATGEGAHHVAITKDWRYAFVQNSLLNLPGMSDGSITVIDLKAEKVIGSVDTLKNEGFNPNSIVLLPEWNDPAGH